MPISNSVMPAISAALTSMQTALTAAVNAARDDVKTDNGSKATAVTTAVNAARDDVKADNVTQITAARADINGNTSNKAIQVTAAVNAKGVIKSIQRGESSPYVNTGFAVGNVIIAAVDVSKTIVLVSSTTQQTGVMTGGGNGIAQLASSTELQIKAQTGQYSSIVKWQVVEYW